MVVRTKVARLLRSTLAGNPFPGLIEAVADVVAPGGKVGGDLLPRPRGMARHLQRQLPHRTLVLETGHDQPAAIVLQHGENALDGILLARKRRSA